MLPDRTTRDELLRAIDAGRKRRTEEPRATSVRYDPERDAVEIELTDGAAVRIRRSGIDELSAIPIAALTSLRVTAGGYGVKLDQFDIAISVFGLVMSVVSVGAVASTLGRLDDAKR